MFNNFINFLVIHFINIFLFYDSITGQTILSSNKTEIEINEICFSSNCPTPCTTWKIDAILNYRNGTILAFKGNYFWEILNENKRPTPSNANLISKYWNTGSKIGNPFKGPIDAALNDDKGYTYFFKGDKVFIFKHSSFVDLQTVPSFNSINSALLVNHMKDNESNIYIFKGDRYWQILPIRKMYDWVEVSSIFKYRDVEAINFNFPINIDAAFQDKNNNIIIIKGPQYIRIPAHDFPNSIKSSDLIPKFVFSDIYYCEKSFYEQTIFSNYDAFLLKVISHDFQQRTDIPLSSLSSEKNLVISPSYWYYVVIGIMIGVGSTVLLQCLFAASKRSFSETRVIGSKIHTSEPNSERIDLIRKSEISIDI